MIHTEGLTNLYTPWVMKRLFFFVASLPHPRRRERPLISRTLCSSLLLCRRSWLPRHGLYRPSDDQKPITKLEKINELTINQNQQPYLLHLVDLNIPDEYKVCALSLRKSNNQLRKLTECPYLLWVLYFQCLVGPLFLGQQQY